MAYSDFPRRKPPLGFRIWFGFVATLIACIFAGVAYLLFTIGSDPTSLGRLIGSIVDGYQQRSNASGPAALSASLPFLNGAGR